MTIEQPASWMRTIIWNLWIDQKRSSRNRLSAPLEDAEHVGTGDTERALIARSTLTRYLGWRSRNMNNPD